MRYYHSLIASALLALTAACAYDPAEIAPEPDVKLEKREITLEATLPEEDSQTKTAISDGHIYWLPNNKINVFFGSDSGEFTTHINGPSRTATFNGQITISNVIGAIDGEDTSNYLWALYPYDPDAIFNGNSIITHLDSYQLAVMDTFADDTYIAVARSASFQLGFWNVLAGMKFSLRDNDIQKVWFVGSRMEPLAGTLIITFDNTGKPEVSRYADGDPVITLAPGAVSTLSAGHLYYILFPPTYFRDGFRMLFKKGNQMGLWDYTGGIEIPRNYFASVNEADSRATYYPTSEVVEFDEYNLKQFCVEHYDIDGDGEINMAEAQLVTKIVIKQRQLQSVKGIEHFPNLTQLDVRYNNLTSLDVSQNPKLASLNCEQNYLTSLDVSQNPALESLNCSKNNFSNSGIDVSHNPALASLYCDDCGLTNIDVSHNPLLFDLDVDNNSLTSLDLSGNPELYRLDADHNLLTAVNLSGCPKMETMFLNGNNLTSLDLSGNPILKCLYLDSNQLTGIDVSCCPLLITLSTRNNLNLPRIDVSSNSNLRDLCCDNYFEEGDPVNILEIILKAGQESTLTYISYNPDCTVIRYLIEPDDAVLKAYCLENFDTDNDGVISPAEAATVQYIIVNDKNISSLSGIEGFPNLKRLHCDNTRVTSIDVSHNPLLEVLSFNDCTVSSIDLSNNPALEVLQCDNAPVGSLDLSHNPLIDLLSCNNAGLTTLDVSNLTSLSQLYCNSNSITGTLDLRNNPFLYNLECSGNGMTYLRLEGLTNLINVDCSNNKLNSINPGTLAALKNLNCKNNRMTSIGNLNTATALKTLNINDNNFTYININNCTVLNEFCCASNRLKTLDVSGNTYLGILECSDNPLIPAQLDVRGNGFLQTLSCSSCGLTELDLSQNPGLTTLACQDNRLILLDVSGNPELTQLYCTDNALRSLDVHTNTRLKTLDCINNEDLYRIKIAVGQADNFTTFLHDQTAFVAQIIPFVDPVFKSFCVSHLDCDNDGEVDEAEALDDFATGEHSTFDLRQMNISSLAGIEFFIFLRGLNLEGNNLTTLDLSMNSNLIDVNLKDNSLTSLTLGPNIEALDCSNNNLTSLDPGPCHGLVVLICSNNNLTSLDLRDNERLHQLSCSGNPNLTDVYLNPALENVGLIEYDSAVTTLHYVSY